MEAIKEIKRDGLPVRTWNRLEMNDSVLRGEDAEMFAGAKENEPIEIVSAPGETKEHVLRFECKDGEKRSQEVKLSAGEGSRLTVWMEASSASKDGGFLAVHTEIKAEKGAKVRFTQTQLLGSKYRFVNDIRLECGEGAGMELTQLFLGGEKTWSGFKGELNGTGSAMEAQIGYWERNTQWLDMNYVVYHREKSTRSRIVTRGVLEDRAYKLFRGTIDFKKGASGSEGEETEEVLMLGDDAVCRTIPVILCGEENVQGNHGATIGEPDEDTLVYLASRGIGKDEATALLARSRIDRLCAGIENEAVKERVQKYLEGAAKK